jgi:hypothetical protein
MAGFDVLEIGLGVLDPTVPEIARSELHGFSKWFSAPTGI